MRARAWRWLLLALFAACCSLVARAQSPDTRVRAVPVDFATAFTDLRPAMRLVRSASARTTLSLPSGSAGESQIVTLAAKGAQKVHQWLVFSLVNKGPRARSLILETALPGMAGARLSPLSPPAPILAAGATGAARVQRIGAGRLRLDIPPRATAGFYLEVSSPRLRPVRLWHARAFSRARAASLLFAGLVLGTALLAVLGFLALYALRAMPALLGAAVFSLGAAGFVLINSGAWQVVFPPRVLAGGLARLEVFSEGLMLTGLVLWLTFWLELPRRSRSWGMLALLVSVLSAALAVWGLAAPRQAVLFLRPAMPLPVIAALAMLAFGMVRRRAADGGGLVSLVLLFIWVLFTQLAAFGILRLPGAGAISSALLVLAVLSLAGVMARAALSPGAALRRFLDGASRRALALTAADLAVWDLDLVSGTLRTGAGLARILALPPDSLDSDGSRAFMDRMHPSDVPAYEAAVQAAAQRRRKRFSVQFRIRRADGGYRWFLLRARPVSDGARGHAPTRLLGVLSDITSIRRSEEHILSDAVRDRVTGLPNRPLLLDRLGRAIHRARGASTSLYLLVLDIDRFRNINDAWGFETGDVLLRHMARRIHKLLEPQDTLARLPGDQFAIIADASAHPRDIIAFAETLRKDLARPFDLGVREVSLTVCIGITHLRGSESLEAEDALKQAEIALFEARKKGNDALAFFEKSMLAGRSQQLSLEQDLRRAVERGEMEVVYQPIMYLANGHLAGFEALVRWRHPLHGLIGPDSFIPLAEEIGIIGEIGEMVLREAVRHLGVWQRAFRPERPLFVSVNISSAQLLNAALVDEVSSLVTREGIAPQTLKLELTESLLMENPELGRKILERIAGLGVRIACDDFGTGYSSLSNLRNLPFSTLKIDRSFVTSGEDEAAAIILDSIILMAHGLGMDIIAEGLETTGQMRHLAELGCDMGQGWVIGAPVSARRVMEAFTGTSLTPSTGDRFRAIRERLARHKTQDDEEASLRLPPAPIPPVAGPDDGEGEEAGQEAQAAAGGREDGASAAPDAASAAGKEEDG